MLSGFDVVAVADEEEASDLQANRRLLRSGSMETPITSAPAPPTPSARCSSSTCADVPLWLIFFTLCFSVGTFMIDSANTTCWTARDELMLLRSLQLEQDSRGPWPLAAAHSENDHLQSEPLLHALSLGFCSVGVKAKLEEESGLIKLANNASLLKRVYLDTLLERSQNGTVLPHSLRLGTCIKFTLSVEFENAEKIPAWRALEQLVGESNPEYLQILMVVGEDDAALMEAMENASAKVGVELRLPATVGNGRNLQNAAYSMQRALIKRVSVQASEELDLIANLANCPVLALIPNEESKPAAAWEAQLQSGAKVLGTSDLLALSKFLKQQ